MTNTTPRYYAINGTSLQTYRWNLVKIDGIHSRPAMRGQNPQTPYRHGSYSYGRKFFEEKFMVLRMAILNTDENGAITLADSWAHLYKNLDDFMKMMYDDTQLTLDRILADGTSHRRIFVEAVDESDVKTESKDQRYLIDVPLVAARPFWDALPMITDTELAITGTRAFTIATAGNAPTDDMVITIDCTSDGASPKLSIPSTDEEISILDTNITSGDQIILNLGTREFTKNGDRYDVSVGREVAWFMQLPPSQAALGMSFTSTSGTFNLKIERYDKWF